MGKRHQANRRKVYGRRQHEVRERTLRQLPERLDVRTESYGFDDSDPSGFLDFDFGSARLRLAMGD